jgi:hypothetical protein
VQPAHCAGFGLALWPDSGVGAITLMSGSTVWAGALDGAIDSPTAIAGATTDARRPQEQMSRFFILAPVRYRTSHCLTVPESHLPCATCVFCETS